MKHAFNTLLLALTLFALCGCATPPATTPETPSTPAPQKVANPAVIPAHRLHLEWWRLRLAEKEAQAQTQHDTVLLGDSITHNWDVLAPDLQQTYFGNALNLGFSGDRTQDVLWRIRRINWQTVAPKRIMVMIGTNNTGWNLNKGLDPAPEMTFEGIRAIVDTLKQECPQAKITLLYIFPRGVNGNDAKRRANDRINQMIPTLADGERVVCKDISTLYFAEEDGHTLRRDLMPDLLHPNKEGHRLWGEAVVTDFMAP